MSTDVESFRAPIELDPTPFFEESPLFAEARERQSALASQTFDTIQDARNALNKNIAELDEAAAAQGLIGEKLTLRAPRLHIPTVSMDFEHGTYLNSVTVVEPDEDDIFNPPTAEGMFTGFTHTIQGKPGPDESVIHIRPTLHYQVMVTDHLSLPHNAGPQFAYASVEDATLEFQADKQRRDAAVALGHLLADESDAAQMLTHNLNTMVPLGEYDYRTLRAAGRMARLYLDRQGDQASQAYKDGIIDLIASRLGLYYDSEFAIRAIAAITSVDENGSRHVRASLGGVTKVQAVTFAPYFYNQQSKWKVSPTENAVSIALLWEDPTSEQGSILNVPLEKLQLLTPLGA